MNSSDTDIELPAGRTSASTRNTLPRELLLILFITAAIAFIFNGFAANGLPLIRIEPKKVAASDSMLFSGAPAVPKPAVVDTVIDSVTNRKIPVIAPLHQAARAKPDSALRANAKKDTSPYTVVSLEQLKRLMAQHRGMIIDARNAEDFPKGHIPTARNIPFMDLDKHFEELSQIPQDTLVIIYCNGPDCHLGRGLADFMIQMEFHHVYLYDDGWDGWQKAKMPEEKSEAKSEGGKETP